MPNWCKNRLYVRGNEEQLEEFVRQAKGVDTRCIYNRESQKIEDLVFNRLVPMPEDILAKPYDPDGYYWELSNWGCKWGANDSRLIGRANGRACYEFYTPWMPPLAFLLNVSEQFPYLTFILVYSEPGMAFVGFAVFHNKELKVEVTTYDYDENHFESLSEFFCNAEYSYVVEDVGLQLKRATEKIGNSR